MSDKINNLENELNKADSPRILQSEEDRTNNLEHNLKEKRVSINNDVKNYENENKNKENNDYYITYSKAKESSRTLSRDSIRSNNRDLIKLSNEMSEEDQLVMPEVDDLVQE